MWETIIGCERALCGGGSMYGRCHMPCATISQWLLGILLEEMDHVILILVFINILNVFVTSH